MKKVIALILAIAMILTLSVSVLAEEGSAVKWQLVGVHTEEGEGANYTNGAFLVNLYEDGTVVVDRFLFLAGDNSDFATNSAYQAGFMVGTWELAEKDGQLQASIKLLLSMGQPKESIAKSLGLSIDEVERLCGLS